MEDPARASSSPAGRSCLHLPWMCSSSQGAGCFGERGHAHLFCHRHYGFLKSVVASLGTHTHPGEEASAGISSLAVWGFSREEGEAHAPVRL